MDRPSDERLPDIDEENAEQDERGTQANDVADDARLRQTDLSQDSERGGRSNPAQIIPDDVPDLVDKMKEMNRSGRIDNGAFEGEPQLDDEESALGETDDLDDDDGLTVIDDLAED
ncbi:hypothetical protein WG907_01605 [Sphingobium sp. AN558]|uniref:hypothetical protein n=1 Tax=Sphingobium sp. AN558 TaxID=3133442 RepID=UPI0030BDBC67